MFSIPRAARSLAAVAVLALGAVASVDAQTLNAFAGNGTSGYSGDGGQATSAKFTQSLGIVRDSLGNVFISDTYNHRVRKVATNGVVTTYAGNGTAGYSGDGGPAAQAKLSSPAGLAIDTSNNLYIAEFDNGVIRKVTPGGTITTFAGIGVGFAGDGGPATQARFNGPYALAFDPSGNLFVGDDQNHRIRKISKATGIITTYAGNGGEPYACGDEGPAVQACMAYARGLSVDSAGVVYFADGFNTVIRKITTDGIIHHVAGQGYGFGGDGGPAATAQLWCPDGMVVLPDGTIYLSDIYNYRIRRISSGGIISTVVGNGQVGNTGDGGPALQASLNEPGAMAYGGGKIYFEDMQNNRVRVYTIPASTAPSAPFIGEAMPGNTQASVAFSAPADSGGSTITGYTVASTPSGGVDSDAGTTKMQHLITGLANGTSYTFQVTATNAIGTSPSSAASSAVVPAPVPGPPVIGIAVAGNSEATVSFSAPANVGSGPVTGYQVYSSPAGGIDSQAGSTALTHTVTGLQNTTQYTFYVRATNASGTGFPSASSNVVMPLHMPSEPRNVTAVVSEYANSAEVSYDPPLDEGEHMSGYRVVSIPAGGVDNYDGQWGQTHTVSGLTAGVSYTFKVQALTLQAEGPFSAPSNAVVPFDVPGAPTNVVAVAGNGSATVSFLPPSSNGGRPITGYTIESTNPNFVDLDWGTVKLTHRLNIPNGQTHTFRVRASNSGGIGPLSAPSNTITPSSSPQLTIADVNVIEGNAGTRVATFTVRLSVAAAGTVGFNLATANGSATAASDYLALSLANQTIPAGETSKSFNVTINGDATNEADETFAVNVTGVSGASVADGQATGTILNDDGGVGVLVIDDVSVVEGDGGSKTATFTISLAAPQATDVSVNVGTIDDSATAGSDYEANAVAGLVIPAGSTSASFSVNIVSDLYAEPDETFYAYLESAVGANILDGLGAGTIVNDDSFSPAMTISDATIVEGDSGTRIARFTLSLAKPASDWVSFERATGGGTATLNEDYMGAFGGGYIAPGESSVDLDVYIYGDSATEADETYEVTISNVQNATLVDGVGLGTIVNDDGAPDKPSLSVADLSVTEGNDGQTTADFVVQLDKPATVPVTFTVHTEDGTAISNIDFYDIQLTPVTIEVGETSKTFSVLVNGDTGEEFDEQFEFVVQNVSGAYVVKDHATGTIISDELPPPTLELVGATVVEGNSGTKLATFTVQLSRPAPAQVSFDASTIDGGTATAGSDYQALSSSPVVIAAGQSSATFSVVVNGDTTVEPDEYFYVGLNNYAGPVEPIGYMSSGTITNDDSVGGASLSIGDVTIAEGNSGTKVATFTVNLSQALGTAVKFDIATADGTAAAGSDYVATSALALRIPAGNTSKTFSVTINGDTTQEADETFLVNLANPVNATIADGQGVGTISNDDSASQAFLSIDDASFGEGNSGPNQGGFLVRLLEPAPSPVTFNASTSNGTAQAGVDFELVSTSVTIPQGGTSAFVVVNAIGDTLDEPNETFTVTLSNVSGAQVADGQALGTILDDDGAPPPTLSVGDVSVTEGNSGTKVATFTVTLSAAQTSPVYFDAATGVGSATAGTDYVAKSTAGMRIAAGNTTKAFSVTINGDTDQENDEVFFVNLSNPVGASLSDGQAMGTIVNDDAAATPTLSIADASVSEGNSGTKTLTFTVSLNQAIGGPVSYDIATSNGSATAGSDYVASSLTGQTIAAGGTSKTFAVTINGDATNEANETFNVTLSNVSGVALGDGSAVGTITNDDGSGGTPTLTIADVSVAEGNSLSKQMTFTVKLSAAATGPVTYNIATANGTALAPGDYTAKTLTGQSIAAGATSKTFTVAIKGDKVVEPNETFTVNVTGVSGATVGDGQAVGTISNDDAAAIGIARFDAGDLVDDVDDGNREPVVSRDEYALLLLDAATSLCTRAPQANVVAVGGIEHRQALADLAAAVNTACAGQPRFAAVMTADGHTGFLVEEGKAEALEAPRTDAAGVASLRLLGQGHAEPIVLVAPPHLSAQANRRSTQLGAIGRSVRALQARDPDARLVLIGEVVVPGLLDLTAREFAKSQPVKALPAERVLVSPALLEAATLRLPALPATEPPAQVLQLQ